MSRDRSFWRNVAIVVLSHAVLLLGVARWGASAKKPLGNDVVWMEEGATLSSAQPNPTPKEESFTAPPPMEEPSPAEAEEEEQPNISAATNDIPLATPSSTPKPTPAVTPRPKSSPKPSPKPTPKKSKATTIASKKTSDKKSKSEAAPKESTASVPSSGVGVPGGRASGTGSAAQFSAYGRMLHDRFFNEWDQPTSVVASGVKMSVLVRLRIEKDGRVSDFALVRPSGNVVVDESVAAVAKRVIKVDPLPEGLGKGGHYEVNINFELNAD